MLGSRELSYSGNFSSQGGAVYQTNHGAAFDIVGQDLANPVAQILTLAMMLRESFRLSYEAALIEKAIADVCRRLSGKPEHRRHFTICDRRFPH